VVDAPSLETFKVRLDGDSEQPNPVGDVPAHCRGFGLDDPWRSLPTQNVL